MLSVPERVLSFGVIAEAYERFRPGYPDELLQAVADQYSQAELGALQREFDTRDAIVSA
jgi:hypothetical protein